MIALVRGRGNRDRLGEVRLCVIDGCGSVADIVDYDVMRLRDVEEAALGALRIRKFLGNGAVHGGLHRFLTLISRIIPR